MISVLILTKDEEQDLPGCLASVTWSDDVHVFDSGSIDATLAIAKARGAQVSQRPFDDYAGQRNAALHGLRFKHSWVLILDADERVPAALHREMVEFLRSHRSEAVAACRIRRRDFLNGTWLKHSQISPFYIRLVRPQCVRYEREVNEILRVDGAICDLSEPFDHFPFSKGIRHWIAKHNIYSSMEANCIVRARASRAPVSVRKALLSRDFNERRFYQKELFYRLPARPLIKFLYMYLWRRGFLDGKAGFSYAILQSLYEYMIVLKTNELEQKRLRCEQTRAEELIK